MFRYNKTTQCAVAAISKLAEVYDGKRLISSADIAQSRRLSKPLVAKLLTLLSQAGYIEGTPGPGGGYRLSRPPQSITMFEIASLFERTEEAGTCPFGPIWCRESEGAPCPLHNELMRMHNEMMGFLKKTTFAVFQKNQIEAS